MQGIINCVQVPVWTASAPIGQGTVPLYSQVQHTHSIKECMHAHDVYFKPKQSCWMGIFVTAQEHAPLCLETEIKTSSCGS